MIGVYVQLVVCAAPSSTSCKVRSRRPANKQEEGDPQENSPACIGPATTMLACPALDARGVTCPLARSSPAASDQCAGRSGATPRRMPSLRSASAGHDLVPEPRPKPPGGYPGCVLFPELKVARCSQHWLSLCHPAHSARSTEPPNNRSGAQQGGAGGLEPPGACHHRGHQPALPWWRAGLTRRQPRDPGAHGQTTSQLLLTAASMGPAGNSRMAWHIYVALLHLPQYCRPGGHGSEIQGEQKGTGDGWELGPRALEDRDTRKWVHTYQAIAASRRVRGRVTVVSVRTTKNTQVKHKVNEVFKEEIAVQLTARRRQLE